jgi:hypothetical protein
MISALWLLAIVPTSAFIGFLCAALLAANGTQDDEVESITIPDEEEVIRECRRRKV